MVLLLRLTVHKSSGLLIKCLMVFWYRLYRTHVYSSVYPPPPPPADCWLCTRWQWPAMLEQPNSASHMHVVNLSYWKTGITGALLHFLFKQAITPLHHYHREKGGNEPQLRSSGRDLFNALILGAGKVLREEVIKTAPSTGNKKQLLFSRKSEELDCCF